MPLAEDDSPEIDDGSAALTTLPVKPFLEEPALLVNDTATLRSLESSGFALANWLSGTKADNASMLATSKAYAQIAALVRADLDDLMANDKAAGVGTRFAHRVFDANWLGSALTRFELVGITNRSDRRHVTTDGCGEVHFIYRLAYSTKKATSRLPMTLVVVVPNAGTKCAEVASAWLGLPKSADALMKTVLANLPAATGVELNLQAVRWPSSVRKDFGGHAEYLLRVMKFSGSDLVASPLENTVSPQLSSEDSEALRRWVVSNAKAIDRGTALVPERFLVFRAYSIASRGLARAANRPFKALFDDGSTAFSSIDYASLERIKSPAALVRRLDTMSCQGCHQSRSMAGFHLLGRDDAHTADTNHLNVDTSPHFNDELPWRKAALEAMSKNTEVIGRPFAERGLETPGVYGAPCATADIGFASWTCASGLECVDISGDEIGACMRKDVSQSGEMCELSEVTRNQDSHLDRNTNLTNRACETPNARTKCSASASGFPHGACTGKCDVKQMGKGLGDTICGATPPAGFNECIAAGEGPDACLANPLPVYRRACDLQRPCGGDYVCAGVPGASSGVGGCMPPYFLFQVRVDGHVVR
jgi:hypothetical protein